MALANTARRTYAAGTEGMQVAPEAPSQAEGASEAFLRAPVLPAACQDDPGLEWVPDLEQPLVPASMRQLCSSCPGRAACLQWAMVSRSVGYWAGTTTVDRQQLADAAADLPSIELADQLQAVALAQAAHQDAHDLEQSQHPVGQDSLWWYRRGGCRCRRCRAHNAAWRSDQRARARRAAQSAAA